MTALYIILSVLFFCFLLLLFPVTVDFSTNGDIKCKIYFSIIKVFDTQKKRKVKEPKETKKTEAKGKKEKPKNDTVKKLFLREKDKNGTVGAIKYFTEALKEILSKMVWLIKKLKFSKIDIKLFVGSDNAAKTAVEYGVICTAAYPLLSLITTNAKVKYKAIDISADFNSTCVTGNIEFFVTAKTIYLLIGFIKIYKEYKKIMKESVK